MHKKLASILVAGSFLLSTLSTFAQVGTGWTQKTFSERYEYESNDVLITISPPPTHFTDGFSLYDRTNGVETFQLLSRHSNRAEIRPNDDYSTSSRQFQSDVLITAPTHAESIHQIFNGPTGPWLIIREQSNFNGSIRMGGGTSSGTLASNLYGNWFRLNSINDMNNGQTYIYVNGTLVWQSANPGGTFYTKYGAYGSHDDAHPAKVQFKNAKLFTGGNSTKQDFTLTASPSSQGVLSGDSASYTVTTAFTNTVNNVVYLSISGLPAGATAGFSPSSITGSGSSTLTVNTSGSTPGGTYTLTITGATTNSSFITHTKTVTLSVQDFSVGVTPASQTVASGGTGTYTATVTAANGFGGTVTWSASGLPAGATANFSPASLTGAGSSTMTLTLANNTPAGTYNFTVTGTSGSTSHSATATVIVSDFSISATPSSQTVTAGNSTTYTASIGSANGFSDAVNLSVSGLPSGATGAFSANPIGAPGSSTLTVSTTTSTPAGTYTLTITGIDGGLNHSTTVSLIINAPPPPDFSLSASPNNVTVTQGSSVTVTLTKTDLNGYSGTVTLSASGLPSGITASFAPVSTTSTSTLTLTASSTATLGTSTLTITGTDGTLTHTIPLTLTVNPSSSGALPSGWTDADIGAVGLAGSASYNAGAFTVSGSGSDIWTTGDQCNYASQSVAGDTTVIARVISENQTAGFAKAGVMIRESLATNSIQASVLITPTNGVAMEVRSATGVATINVVGWVKPVLPPQWVKLVRSGSTFTASYSANGTTWTQIASTNVTMAATATAGLAVTAHNNAALNTATFDNVSVSVATIDTTAIYQLQNVASSLVLNNQGSLTNGSKVTQWSSASTSVNLQWKFIATSNGYYQINSVKSGLDAAVQSASTASGAGIVQWAFGSAGNDQWKPVPNSDGSYTLVNLHSGLVLGDPGSSTSTSTQMDQETSNGGANQKWKLLKQ